MTIVGNFFLANDVTRSVNTRANGKFAGLLAAALIALSSLHIHWSQQVKMYSLGTCLTVWSTWFLIRWFQNGSTWRLVSYVLLAATLSLQHHYGTFTVFGQLTFALGWSAKRSISAKNWDSFLTIFIAGWATLTLWALWLPSFLIQRTLVKNGYWIKEFQWPLVFNLWVDLLLLHSQIKLPSEFGLLISQFVVVIILLLLFQKSAEVRLIGWLVMIPCLIAVTWSRLDENVLVSRYLINAQVCFTVGISVLVAGIQKSGLRFAVAVILIVGSGFTGYQQRIERSKDANVPGMPKMIQVIKETKTLGEPLLVCNPMLYLNVCAHAGNLTDAYAFDRGYPYPHFQGTPVMKDEEYLSILAVEEAGHEWVWTLDAENWLGGNWKVNLPFNWKLQEEQKIPEWYATLVLRVYRREPIPAKKTSK